MTDSSMLIDIELQQLLISFKNGVPVTIYLDSVEFIAGYVGEFADLGGHNHDKVKGFKYIPGRTNMYAIYI